MLHNGRIGAFDACVARQPRAPTEAISPGHVSVCHVIIFSAVDSDIEEIKSAGIKLKGQPLPGPIRAMISSPGCSLRGRARTVNVYGQYDLQSSAVGGALGLTVQSFSANAKPARHCMPMYSCRMGRLQFPVRDPSSLSSSPRLDGVVLYPDHARCHPSELLGARS